MIHILVGNIATIKGADVIVNSANKTLRTGSGVSGAIHKLGGKDIAEECKVKYPNGIATCQVAVTKAWKLDALFIFHILAPKYRFDTNPLDMLERCYSNALDKAKEYECESIAFPLLGAGIHGFSDIDAINTAIKACSDSKLNIVLVVANKSIAEQAKKCYRDWDIFS